MVDIQKQQPFNPALKTVVDVKPVKKKVERGPLRTISIDATEIIRNRLNMTPSDFSWELGYSRSSYYAWIKSRKVPITASLAAECLMRRQANSDTTFIVTLVKGVPKVTMTENTERININGKWCRAVPE